MTLLETQGSEERERWGMRVRTMSLRAVVTRLALVLVMGCVALPAFGADATAAAERGGADVYDGGSGEETGR